MSLRALLIDDDLRLGELLTEYFAPHSVEIAHARSGPEGLRQIERGGYDIVLLDLTMPGMDGLEVCRRIRERSRIPIVMLTARGDETDRVVGLELGADDYLPKPFAPRELLARIRAVLRRTSVESSGDHIRFGSLEIDLDARRVTVAGAPIDLTALEYDLLVVLAKRRGRVIPRDKLFSLAGRGEVNVLPRTVDVHISHLRRKLKLRASAGEPELQIRTVRGVGYVLTQDGQ